MAWVAFDRAVKAVERYGLQGPVETWRSTRDQIHAQVCASGFDGARHSFVQYYGSQALDASLLLIPMVGFLPADDARVLATIAAIEAELLEDGLVLRYAVDTASAVDGLPPGEGVFLPCSFWLADCMAVTGRHAEAEALFERLLALRNDVGLLSEEFDPRTGHMQGNFPQALSHMALVNTARLLSMPSAQITAACEQGERPAAAKAAP
jgi:GH15 family glucan-1,4-alpha-glucosidase